jgi:hypothetical protein
MDGERCGRKKPAIIARNRYGLLSIKKASSKMAIEIIDNFQNSVL